VEVWDPYSSGEAGGQGQEAFGVEKVGMVGVVVMGALVYRRGGGGGG